MEREQRPGQIVYTNKARCRDCYRCVRVCPVKAIRMCDGQAYVVEERCIACGTCIRECPQKAKSFRNDIERVIRLRDRNSSLAVSIAPSFAAVFEEWEQKRLPSALRKLGFDYVAETAQGAFFVAEASHRHAASHANQSWITTACPAVVNFIRDYQPQYLDLLIPVVSPMVAHARHLKQFLGESVKVVFIGPCVAKKAEAEEPIAAQWVDAVLTFSELQEWMDNENLSLSELEESGFDEGAIGNSRYFPLLGGLAKTARVDTDSLSPHVMALSGIDELTELAEHLSGNKNSLFIEPLFCRHGCINGPAIHRPRNLFYRRQALMNYADTHPGSNRTADTWIEMNTRFQLEAGRVAQTFSEDRIRQVLGEIGQVNEADQLNCGACGYPTCRDRAVAVLQGMAVPEMCIPYMRRLAERRTDKIIESSPNGIVILDDQLRILSMNPAFRRNFMCSEAVLGKPIAYLIDPDPFEQLSSGAQELIEATVKYDQYHIICHQIMYQLQQERQFVGIFVNVTHVISNQQNLAQLREQTVDKARALLAHQVSMAQQLTKFLGESTAEGEELVAHLLRLAETEPDASVKGQIWETYTLK